MKILRKAPAVRLLVPLIAGILFSMYLSVLPLVWIVGAIVALPLVFIPKWRPVAFFIWMFVAGGLSISSTEIKLNSPEWKKADYLVVQLTAPLKEGAKTYHGIFEVKEAIKDSKRTTAEGLILLYLQKDKKLSPGDDILISNNLSLINPPSSPGQFDAKAYWHSKHIVYSGYLPEGSYVAVPSSSNISPLQKLRSLIQEKLFTALPDISARGIAEALLIGETSEIQQEVKSNFSTTGTIHVLSVSGLHVGSFFILLAWLTAPMRRNKPMRLIRMMLILLILWGYAFLTGLSAPVNRAVLMFSFMMVGMTFSRSPNIYNSVFLAALVLLILDPYYLVQTGFQLSFIAVLGIVWLQPIIARAWSPSGKFLHWAWQLMATSMAAQLATLPLCLYYFHQFPTWFLLSNLLIVPIATFIMALAAGYVLFAMAATSFSWITAISAFLGAALKFSILLLLGIVKMLADLPFASMRGFYISSSVALLLAGFLLFLFAAAIYRKKQWLWPAFAIGLCGVMLQSANRYSAFKEATKPTFISYSGHLILTAGGEIFFYAFTDSALIKNKDKAMYFLRPYAADAGYDEQKIKLLDCNNSQVINEKAFQFKSPFLIHNNRVFSLAGSLLPVDAVVFNKLSMKDTAIFAALKPNAVVMAASSPNYVTSAFEKKAAQFHSKFIDLKKTYYRP